MATFNAVFAIVTLSLAIQIAVLALLIYGYVMFRRLNFRKHGVIMALAVALHMVMVFALMVPSFVLAVLPFFIEVNPFQLTSLVSIFHEITGAIALGLGVWFVASWRFRKNFSGCFNKRKLMVITMVSWLTTLTLGIALYIILNWTILVG
jgi:hypothetical protein